MLSLPVKLVSKRKLDYLALCYSLVVLGLTNGYSFSNIRWLMAQAALESDWGTSNLATNHNNFFGMWKPNSRRTVNAGTYATNDTAQNVEYLVYTSAWQCAKDRILWDKEFTTSVYPYRNSKGYPDAVASRYHSSDGYSPAVGNVLTVHESEFKRITGAVMLACPLEIWAVTKMF